MIKYVMDKIDFDIKTQRVAADLGRSCPTIYRDVDIPEYTGTYEVSPGFEEVVLPTQNKRMQRDVVVEEISVYIVSNESGGNTVIIGEGGIVFNG